MSKKNGKGTKVEKQRLRDRLAGLFSRPRRAAPPRQTLGHMGTAVYGGYINEAEKNAKLTGTEKYRTYSDILANCAIVASGVRFFLNLVGKAAWEVEPADDTPAAQEIAERVEAILHDMRTPWTRVVRRSAGFKLYGFAIQEWTAKVNDDGTIGMLDVAPRAQKTVEQWDVDQHGRVFGVVQRSPETFERIYLPRQKLVYLVDDALNDSPEGLGLFRHLVDSYDRLSRYEELEGVGFESDLRGMPLGRAPIAHLEQQETAGIGEAGDAQKQVDEFDDLIKGHIASTSRGLILESATYKSEGDNPTPSGEKLWDLELLQSTPSTQSEVGPTIERINREMARVLHIEHLMLGSEGSGSLALSRDKSHNFALFVTGTLREIADSYQSDFVETIMRLNGWPEELEPTLKPEAVQWRDIEQLSGMLTDLSNAGGVMLPDHPAFNAMLDLAGLPTIDPEEMPDVPMPREEPAPAEETMEAEA